ncbi:MAG TPA: phenylalanine--tRNA ligase subunit beta [Streptosporangiaceae bacterium]|nr:phenylalanine--tRNA ligase subunit beta [Streptosporangiaceae bacterium]
MRVPISWLRQYAPVPDPVDVADVARRLTAAGLEVEAFESVGHDVRGVVVGQVLSIEELTGMKKPIRYCRVAVSESQLSASPEEASGVICGATNFAVGDRVALALPGAMLPGGSGQGVRGEGSPRMEISARRTYGRMSEGMICSVRELGIGEEHDGILVLSPDAPLGADFVTYAALRDDVLDIAVNPDRGYAVSIRGVARELAGAYGVPFTDPASDAIPAADVLGGSLSYVGSDVWPASISDPTACDRFVLREVRGFSPSAKTPVGMMVRLARCGVRSVSLAVDVTNYLMLELGQPLHAFDRSRLSGPIAVRRALPGEKLETLDHVVRSLDPADILITDSSGPISMAGTMGGLSTEISDESTDLVIEGAHFSDVGTAVMSRRHKLQSEASYRFERGVDRELPLPATAKAVAMLAALGGPGARVVPGCTHASVDVPARVITMAADYPDRVAGVVYGRDVVMRRLREVGCEVRELRGADATEAPTVAPWRTDAADAASGPVAASAAAASVAVLEVTPPTWRPDLTDPADLAEEVIRLEGYENVPARMPRALAGRGLTPRQRLKRSIGRTLAESGYVEVLSSPFGPRSDADLMGFPAEDLRRPAVVVANALSDEEPLMRTSLLPGLFRMLARNVGRGFPDLGLFEIGLVFRPRPGAAVSAPILAVDHGPSVGELASLEAALPDQPAHLGAVLCGARTLAGWWGAERPADWSDAVDAARAVARECRVSLSVRADMEAPWHPGRCAAIYAQVPAADGSSEPREWLAGHAGELHPRVIKAFALPPRTCAVELDLSVLYAAAEQAGAVQAPVLSAYPLATQDVALTVPADVPAASVAEALVAGAGPLLEDLRLFDVYTGEQVGSDKKSLAYTLRFRAPGRTLKVAETTAARDAAVAEAARRVGAELRGG